MKCIIYKEKIIEPRYQTTTLVYCSEKDINNITSYYHCDKCGVDITTTRLAYQKEKEEKITDIIYHKS